MSKGANVLLKHSDYEAAGDPYVIEQMAQAALEALIERSRVAELADHQEQSDSAAPEVIDPVLAQMRSELETLKLQAKNKINAAKSEAEEIKAAALKEAEAIKASAKSEGYQQGLAAGTDEGYESGEKKGNDEGLRQWSEQVARWQSVLESTIEQKDKYLADREAVLVKLVFETTAKVLHREIKSEPESVLGLIKAAISKVSDRSHLVVHLNPEDVEKAREADPSVLNIQERVKQIEFQADESVSRGGVRIEAGSEVIDASLDTQLARIARALMETASDDGS